MRLVVAVACQHVQVIPADWERLTNVFAPLAHLAAGTRKDRHSLARLPQVFV